MENRRKPEKVNFSLSPEVIGALRKYALELKGHSRGMSEVAEDAIREYLEKHGITIEAKMGKSENPQIALTLEPIPA